jgi:hypothetical protein
MKRYGTLETLFGKVDLSFAETVLNESYHAEDSVGRPPRKPLDVFKAHLLRRLRHVPSDRMLVRQMWKDPRLRRICDIEENEPPYGIAVLFRFRKRVGPERLMRIVDHAIELLVRKGRIKGEALPWTQPSSRHTAAEASTIGRATAILNHGLEEQSEQETWATGFT